MFGAWSASSFMQCMQGPQFVADAEGWRQRRLGLAANSHPTRTPPRILKANET